MRIAKIYKAIHFLTGEKIGEGTANELAKKLFVTVRMIYRSANNDKLVGAWTKIEKIK